MSAYTDFADELYGEGRGQVPPGVTVTTAHCGSITLTRVHICRPGLARPMGRYITLELPKGQFPDDRNHRLAGALASELRSLLPTAGLVLVAGVGNRRVTADALGPRTAGQILVTRCSGGLSACGLGLRPVAAVAPGAAGITGIPLIQVLRGLVQQLKPAAVLCVDSLTSSDPVRLGRTIQLSDAGLCPAQPGKAAITRQQLGVPVIALGLPTLADGENFCGRPGFILCPQDLDVLVRRGSALLALSVNRALQPSLSLPELCWLSN